MTPGRQAEIRACIYDNGEDSLDHVCECLDAIAERDREIKARTEDVAIALQWRAERNRYLNALEEITEADGGYCYDGSGGCTNPCHELALAAISSPPEQKK